MRDDEHWQSISHHALTSTIRSPTFRALGGLLFIHTPRDFSVVNTTGGRGNFRLRRAKNLHPLRVSALKLCRRSELNRPLDAMLCLEFWPNLGFQGAVLCHFWPIFMVKGLARGHSRPILGSKSWFFRQLTECSLLNESGQNTSTTCHGSSIEHFTEPHFFTAIEMPKFEGLNLFWYFQWVIYSTFIGRRTSSKQYSSMRSRQLGGIRCIKEFECQRTTIILH